MSNIEWTDVTWNPVRGCSRVSDGCRNCYAERQAIRQIKSGYAGLIQRTSHGPAWTGEVRLVPDLLDAPLRWRKPRRIFVNSMSDLFHEKVPDEAILQVFDVMRQSKNGWTSRLGGEHGTLVTTHTFQILTKRPARMLDFCRRLRWAGEFRLAFDPAEIGFNPMLSMSNVWLGVSVEDQATADERIPLLLQTPAAVRFVSYEPALGPVNFARIETGDHRSPLGTWCAPLTGTYTDSPTIDWLIVGGESGPDARPCDVAWIRSAVEQCRVAGVTCFVKQLGTRPVTYHCAGRDRCTHPDCGPVPLDIRDRKGGDPDEWPADLRVREMPR